MATRLILTGMLRESLENWHRDFHVRYGEHAALQRPLQVMQRQVAKTLREWC